MMNSEVLEAVAEAARQVVECDGKGFSMGELRQALAALDAIAADPQPQGETVTLAGIVQQDLHDNDPMAAVRIDGADRHYTGHRIVAHFTVTIPKNLLTPTIPATVTWEPGE